MLVMLLTLALAQDPVDKHIEGFVKGDAAARSELVKLGPRALAALRQARDKNPEKVDALVLEIKKAAAYPKLDKEPGILAVKLDLDMDNQKPADVLAYLREFTGAALLCAFDDADLKAPAVDIELKGATLAQALDRLCRETGLDFGFYHNVLVIDTPERLWGAGKKAAAFGPPATDRQHRTPEDDKTLEKLRRTKVSLDFQRADVRSMTEYVKEIAGIAFEVDPAKRKPIPVFRVKELGVFDVLALITQMRDLDFLLQGGKVFIGPRSEVDKRIAGRK